MTSHTFGLRRIATALTLALFWNGTPALADNPAETALGTTIDALETRLEARIGVLVRDTSTDWQWAHRETERFLMASTFKSVLCGAVLDQADQGGLALDEQLPVRAEEILSYAPVTTLHAGKSLSIGELCFATLDMSDNTAANLLIDRLGGTQGVMAYLDRIGDPTTRLDRKEPDLNIFVPGDRRDTTSPAAMLATWDAMLLGDGLSPASRAQLAEWMRHGGVTGPLIRASTPADWEVADKSGGGRHHTRNLVAMVTPPGRAPYLVAIFVSDTPADWATRNEAVAEIGARVIEVIEAR